MRSSAATQKRTETVCAALRHPLRLRILEALEEGDRSPSQFLQDGLFPADQYESYSQALSATAYHFRALAEAGCIEVVKEIPRRGALERVYSTLTRVHFTDAEFEELPLEQREQLSRSALQGLIARADNAMRAGTFDSRTDRYLVWMPLRLDARAWSELSASLDACFAEVEQIRRDAEARLEETGEQGTCATVGLLGFESPPPPPRPPSD